MKNQDIRKRLTCLAIELHEDVYRDAILPVIDYIERLENDLECIKENCFTIHEVEESCKNAIEALWATKRKE